MRFFKHGEALAIVVPEQLRAKAGLKEGDEFEWLDVGEGVFVLATKEFLSNEIKRIVLPEIKSRLFASPQPASSATTASGDATVAAGFWKKKLFEKGFLVLGTEQEAKEASAELAQEIRKRAVLGARGFDKKYYVCSRQFFENALLRIKKAIGDGEKTAGEISSASKLPFDAALVIITLLKEEGELIEKKRGSYALVR